MWQIFGGVEKGSVRACEMVNFGATEKKGSPDVVLLIHTDTFQL